MPVLRPDELRRLEELDAEPEPSSTEESEAGELDPTDFIYETKLIDAALPALDAALGEIGEHLTLAQLLALRDAALAVSRR